MRRPELGADHRPLGNIEPVTRSPGAMPSLRAVPATTSSTARTGPPEGMSRSESGLVFSAMRKMRPSPVIKIISSDTYVLCIHKAHRLVLLDIEQHAVSVRQLLADHAAAR